MALKQSVVASIWLGWLVGRASCTLDLSLNSQRETQIGIPHLYPSILEANFTGKQNQRFQRFSNDGSLAELLSYLHSISPPHISCLLFDESFQAGANKAFLAYSKTDTSYTSVKFTADLSPLINTLNVMLTSASSMARRHVLVFCSLKNLVTLFERVSHENLESPWIWWLIVVMEEEALQLLQSLIREGSQVLVIHVFSEEHVGLLTSRVNQDDQIGFVNCGSWKKTDSGYKSYFIRDIFVDLEEVYSNFEGRRLTITANNHTFTAMQLRDDGELELVSGFESEIIYALSGSLNFTYRLYPPPDGKWGGRQPDGSIVGMIGVVARREAHFALCEITITPAREEEIDFSNPYYIEILTLVSRTPREKNRAFAVFSPFTPMVWLCLAVATLLIGPIICIQACIIRDYSQKNLKKYSLNNLVFNMLRSLLKQENLLMSVHGIIDVTFLLWYLFALIVSVLYSGMLIATLIKPAFEKPINSLSDLPNAVDNGFTLVVTVDTTDQYLFKEATEGIYADIWQLFDHRNKERSFPLNSDEHYEKILTDKLVIIRGQTAARFITMSKGKHLFHLARDPFGPQYYGLALFTGAPYMMSFNKLISYMTEGGLVSKWRDDGFRTLERNDAFIQESGPRPFTLMQLQAAFYILFMGGGAGASILVIEFVCQYF